MLLRRDNLRSNYRFAVHCCRVYAVLQQLQGHLKRAPAGMFIASTVAVIHPAHSVDCGPLSSKKDLQVKSLPRKRNPVCRITLNGAMDLMIHMIDQFTGISITTLALTRI